MRKKSELDRLLPLSDIADFTDASAKQLSAWAEPSRDNGFPEPKETLGRYKLYDREEVIEWVTLWQKVNKNLGRGKELNGG